MFTGIISHIGTITQIQQRTPERVRLLLQLKKAIPSIRLGSSVSVAGVCLTVAKKTGRELWFDVMEETLRKTNLGLLQPDDIVNVEPSLRLGDEVGGHFVFGHVDTVGEIVEIKKLRNSQLVTVNLKSQWMKYIVPEGSVAIDGVSLTVARVDKGNFTVSLVEYTLEHTTLKFLQKGDRVNVECDMLAKYVLNGKT